MIKFGPKGETKNDAKSDAKQNGTTGTPPPALAKESATPDVKLDSKTADDKVANDAPPVVEPTKEK